MVETVERLCLVIQMQAEVIKKQSAALEQFRAADSFEAEISSINETYQNATGEPISPAGDTTNVY